MLGLNRSSPVPRPPRDVEQVVLRHEAFRRVLGHTGKTIDDIVNCPIARNTVRGYYKLSRHIDRRSEVIDLERQWNAVGWRV